MEGYKTYTRLGFDKRRAECGDQCGSYPITSADYKVASFPHADGGSSLCYGFIIRSPDEKAMRLKRHHDFFFLLPDENFRYYRKAFNHVVVGKSVKTKRECLSFSDPLLIVIALGPSSEAIPTVGSIAVGSPRTFRSQQKNHQE